LGQARRRKALGRSEREKEEMKPTFIALLALCLCVAGCGKKEPV
jgi:hypothetical protein